MSPQEIKTAAMNILAENHHVLTFAQKAFADVGAAIDAKGTPDTYCVEGQDREAGAIGIFEKFSVTVKAHSESEAKDLVRADRIDSHDHTLINSCYLLEG